MIYSISFIIYVSYNHSFGNDSGNADTVLGALQVCTDACCADEAGDRPLHFHIIVKQCNLNEKIPYISQITRLHVKI